MLCTLYNVDLNYIVIKGRDRGHSGQNNENVRQMRQSREKVGPFWQSWLSSWGIERDSQLTSTDISRIMLGN